MLRSLYSRFKSWRQRTFQERLATDPIPPPINWAQWLTANHFADFFGIGVEGQPQPHFATLPWKPEDQDRRAAWALYTELRTRIATQRLGYRAGDESTALESIYQLFDITRRTIKKHERCTHFATLTILILNDRIRPFTASWHRKQVDGRLSSADERFIFRQELNDLRIQLQRFALLLGVLAGDPEAANAAANEQQSRLRDEITRPMPFGIVSGAFSTFDPAAINAAEREEIRRRRDALGGRNGVNDNDAVGLAISGGGIRSATFSLGVLQTLARKGILAQVDFLSTVSGGGYLGSFISSFLNSDREEVKLQPEANPASHPFGAETSPESTGVRHLRNHSKYLTEGGVKTAATVIAFVTYGLLASMLLVTPALLLAVLAVRAFFADALLRPAPFVWLTTPVSYGLLVLAGFSLMYPVVQNLSSRRIQEYWATACIFILIGCVLLIALNSFPLVSQWLRSTGGAGRAMGIVALSAVVLASLGVWLGPAGIGGRIVLTLFAMAGPLLLVLALFLLTEIFIIDWPDLNPQTMAIYFGAVILYVGVFLNINFASPHLFYRNRLARTYLTRLAQESGRLVVEDPQKLSQMNLRHKAPYHIINAALNIPASLDPNLRGRRTDFFCFSKCFCGSPITGFHPTTEWEKIDSHLDLGTAMAISGAAAAPHMGTFSSWRYTFVLAMLNVRLGYWMRRPGRSPVPLANLLNFARELTGYMTGKSRYLNVSDGGHIENLGIYELLRRRCKFVIAVDGEADPKLAFGGLLKMTQYARIDLGVKIEPDLSDLRMDAAGTGKAHFVMARIEYPAVDAGDPPAWGLLLYIKSSLTGNEPEFIKKYHVENLDFPHQSTVNQLYSETQFEAYRALGEHIASDLFRLDLVGGWNGQRFADWFTELAKNLLENPFQRGGV